LNTANTYYPQDLTLTGPEETARQALVTKHIIGPALLQEVLNGSDTLYKIKTNYFSYPDNVVLPQYHFTKTLAYAFEKRVEFQKYNKYGQIVEQAKANDFKTTYLWDYHSLYPVAEIKKADSAGVAYTSFEGDSKGGWTYSGSVSADASAPTGGYCYNTTGGNITRSGLTSTTYVVSYWGKNGSVSVNSGSPGVSGRALGNWTYYEHEITGSSITLSGNKYIDEVRLYPKGAMMTTYTFNPLIGMTSQCDINNRIVYYEYDGLGRLVLVRDQDKNIIKKICYNYAGQEESCDVYFNVEKSSNYTRNNCGAGYEGTLVTYTVVAGTYSAHTQSGADSVAQNDVNANGQSYANSHGSCLLIYYNVIKSGNFTRNDCGTGYTGSTVTYTVSANTYNSTISQAYVDSVAQADVNANGQTYANANGTCTSNCNSSNCTGNNKKCINGVCETGVKVYTDGFQKPNGTWQCTYHYEWSDSSWSQDFIETRPSNNPCPCSC
jgi:hypothetical protein